MRTVEKSVSRRQLGLTQQTFPMVRKAAVMCS